MVGVKYLDELKVVAGHLKEHIDLVYDAGRELHFYFPNSVIGESVGRFKQEGIKHNFTYGFGVGFYPAIVQPIMVNDIVSQEMLLA